MREKLSLHEEKAGACSRVRSVVHPFALPFLGFITCPFGFTCCYFGLWLSLAVCLGRHLLAKSCPQFGRKNAAADLIQTWYDGWNTINNSPGSIRSSESSSTSRITVYVEYSICECCHARVFCVSLLLLR
jgi:hypothetical protein